MEIVELILYGKTNHEISESLRISIKTVEGHIHMIFKKMGIRSRYELVANRIYWENFIDLNR